MLASYEVSEKRFRTLLVFTHPVQYTSPFLREMAVHSKFEIMAVYCSLQGAERGHDPGFGIDVAWDVPLLDGYPWVEERNIAIAPGLGRFFGLINPGLWKLIRDGKFDVVLAYTGYANLSFWILATAAKIYRVPLLFGTDATSLKPRDGKKWKLVIKKYLLPVIFGLADAIVIPSEAGRQFMRQLGIPQSRVFLTPFAVDNRWWKERAMQADRSFVRQSWGIPETSGVLLFCAKLQSWKRPMDLLRAYARANVPDTYLVFAGDGPLRVRLEAEAKALNVQDRVRFIGFVNQSGLPAVYRAADLLVLPSEYDPCPVVVCETMLCGCPAAISDEIKGRFDLVENGVTGYVFPCGDVEAIASIISHAFDDPVKLSKMKHAATERMETWTPRDNVEGVARAVAFALKGREPGSE